MDKKRLNELEISLLDPHSKDKMEIPVRFRFCKHVQCFDLITAIALLDETAFTVGNDSYDT